MAGQVVNGVALVRASDFVETSTISIGVKGTETVQWTGAKDELNIVDIKFPIWSPMQGERGLQVGDYSFNFNFTLPPNAPPSFEYQRGEEEAHIRYVLSASVHLSMGVKEAVTLYLIVRRFVPIPAIHSMAMRPAKHQCNENYSSCCGSAGSIEATFTLPSVGICPGSEMKGSVLVDNRSSKDVLRCMLTLERSITLRTRGGHSKHTLYPLWDMAFDDVDTKRRVEGDNSMLLMNFPRTVVQSFDSQLLVSSHRLVFRLVVKGGNELVSYFDVTVLPPAAANVLNDQISAVKAQMEAGARVRTIAPTASSASLTNVPPLHNGGGVRSNQIYPTPDVGRDPLLPPRPEYMNGEKPSLPPQFAHFEQPQPEFRLPVYIPPAGNI
eukprot:CAMPEP_0113879936 /NCGR_PEP_ID=MMETSP0780_2-20120614/7507_1 /TAXON_ID=652834 /ORGANISM="Palpitomonas bilix" /LENGTH=381 /DNA_ID=CAMNT_0000866557 /DNA_START=1691 /DNA_END=2836 /DNA_ORIENTATION=+ /assembly_acc=CAM_ASM_000599